MKHFDNFDAMIYPETNGYSNTYTEVIWSDVTESFTNQRRFGVPPTVASMCVMAIEHLWRFQWENRRTYSDDFLAAVEFLGQRLGVQFIWCNPSTMRTMNQMKATENRGSKMVRCELIIDSADQRYSGLFLAQSCLEGITITSFGDFLAEKVWDDCTRKYAMILRWEQHETYSKWGWHLY